MAPRRGRPRREGGGITAPATIPAEIADLLLEAAGHELRLEALLRRAARAVAPECRGAVRDMAADVRDQARGLMRHAGDSGTGSHGTALGRLPPREALDMARTLAEQIAWLLSRLSERLMREGCLEAALYVHICEDASWRIRDRLEGRRPMPIAVRLPTDGRPRPEPHKPRARRTVRSKIADAIDQVLREAGRPLALRESAERTGMQKGHAGNALQIHKDRRGWVCHGSRGSARWTHGHTEDAGE